MARAEKKVQVNSNQNGRQVLRQVLISRTRLVVEMPDGSPKQLEFQGRDQWGTAHYSDGQFHSTGLRYVPQSTYIVEDSQDYINAMQAL